MDDIRDHLYSGRINKDSDYFALAIISFNLLTNLHPFKGIHSKVGSLHERMIQKISVLDKDPLLKIPKCYNPLQDKNLMEQFKRIFKDGERFLINTEATQGVVHTININKLVEKEGELIISTILSNNDIRYVNASETMACVASKDEITVYDLSNKGYYRVFGKIPITNKKMAPLPTNKNLFVYDNGKLFKYDLKTFNRTEMNDMGIVNPILSKQYGNVFIVVEDDKMYTVYLDEVIGTHIKFDTKDVYGGSFKKYEGVFQNFGTNTYIRTNYKGKLNSI